MGTESQPSMPETIPTPEAPVQQPRAASDQASGMPSGETAVSGTVSGTEERAVVHGTRVGGTYVRTRISPLSHVSPTTGAVLDPNTHTPAPFALKGAYRLSSNPILLLDGVIAGVLLLAFTLSRFGRGWVALVLMLVLIIVLAIVLASLAVIGARGLAKQEALMRTAGGSLIPNHVSDLRHIMIVPLGNLNQPALQCLAYARSIPSAVRAVYVATDQAAEAEVRADWHEWIAACRPAEEHTAEGDRVIPHTLETRDQPRNARMPGSSSRLVVIESPTHAVLPPLLAYIVTIRDTNLDATVTVILSEYMPSHWWQRFLQSQTTWRLKRALYHQPGIMVTTIPYQLPK